MEDFARSLVRVRQLDAVDTTDAWTARVDAAYSGDAVRRRERAALRPALRPAQQDAEEFLLDVNGAAAIAALGLPTAYSALEIAEPYKGDLPLGYSFRYFGRDQLKSIVALARSRGATNQFVPANFYDVDEKIYAGYALADIDYAWGSVLAGARIEHIRNESSAFAVVGGTNRLVTVESDQTLVFPSAHLNIDLDETKRVRLSVNTGAARPDYDDLRPNFTVDDANRTISGGNPLAEPERTTGVDAYFEWYVEPRGYVMAGVFYKDVSDVLATTTRVFGLDTLNFGGTDRSQYVLSTLVNVGDGRLFGAEAAVQLQLDPWVDELGLPEWMGGFGIQANIAYNDSKVTLPGGREVPLPGTSEWVSNLALYYEKYGFSARVVWQHRTEWLDALGGPDTGGDIYWAPDDELDVSLRYAFSDRLEGYIDGKNVLDGSGRRYAGIKERTIEYEKFGAIYSVGIRVTY